MLRENHKGFTMVEMVITLTVMSVIASAALPRIINIVGSAKKGSRDNIVGTVRSGIGLVKIGTIDDSNPFGNLPTELDSLAAGASCNSGSGCFTNVLETGHGVQDSHWSKATATSYDFDASGTVSRYTYNRTNGTFLCTSGSC